MIPGPLEINPAWCPRHCLGAPEEKLRNLALSHLCKGETSFGLDHHFGTIPFGIRKQQTYPSLILFVNLLFVLFEEMFLFRWGATRRIYRLPPAHLQCKGGSKVEDHVEWFGQHFWNSQTRIWSPLCGDHCINSTGKLAANSEFRLFWLLLVSLWCHLRKQLPFGFRSQSFRTDTVTTINRIAWLWIFKFWVRLSGVDPVNLGLFVSGTPAVDSELYALSFCSFGLWLPESRIVIVTARSCKGWFSGAAGWSYLSRVAFARLEPCKLGCAFTDSEL